MAQEKQVYYNQDGVRRTAIFDRDTPDDFTVHTQVDCESIVAGNKVLSELHPTRSTNKHVARVPLTIYEQSIRENWTEEQWKRWLNDGDNAMFRVWKGKV